MRPTASRRRPRRNPPAPSLAPLQPSRNLAARCWRSGGRLTQIRAAFRFPAHRSYAVENEAACAEQECNQHHACCQYRRRESRYETCVEVSRDHRISQSQGDNGEDYGEAREKEEWPHFLEEIENDSEDARSIAECAELALRSRCAMAERRGHFHHWYFQAQRMNRKLRLDLEAARITGKRFDEAAGHRAVPGEDVCQLPPEKSGDQPGKSLVAGFVSCPKRAPFGIQPRGYHHVEMVTEKSLDHPWGSAAIVGAVAVDHQVDVRIDVREHPSNDVSLSTSWLLADDCSCFARHVDGAISGPVVVYVDCRAGQRPPEVFNDTPDSLLLVQAWNENSNLETSVDHRRVLLERQVSGGVAHRGPVATAHPEPERGAISNTR